MLVGRTFLHNCLSVKLTGATDSCHLVWNPWWKRGAGKLLSELTSKIGCSGDTTSEADLCSKGSLILPGTIWMKSRKSHANHVDIFGEEFTRHWDCVPGKGVLWRENRKFMHHSWIWEQCLNQGILFCLSASVEVSGRERWLNNKSKVVCWEAATSKSFSNKVTNPSECHLEKVFSILLPKKRSQSFPSWFDHFIPEIDWYPAESHFYDIFGPFTFQQSTYRFNRESSPSKAIYLKSPNWENLRVFWFWFFESFCSKKQKNATIKSKISALHIVSNFGFQHLAFDLYFILICTLEV